MSATSKRWQGQATPATRARLALALAAAAAVALWLFFLAHTDILLEDALITFRYAENLILGRGFTFNPGERVLGTTTPLHTLLLAAGGWLWGPDHLFAISRVLGLLAALLAGLISYRLLRGATGSQLTALLGTVLFWSHPDVLWSTTGGMETPWVLLFMAASWYAVLRGHWFAAGLLAGLLVLTRVDGIVWCLALAAPAESRRPRSLGTAALGFLAATLPWLIFSLIYFGSPIPHSVLAKAGPGGLERLTPGPATVISHVKWFADGLGVSLRAGAPPVEFTLWFAVVLAGAIAILRSGAGRGLAVAVWFLPMLFLAYLMGRAPQTFPWYLIPVTWCSQLLAAVGLREVWRGLGPRATSSRIVAVLAVSAVVVLAGGRALTLRHAFEFHRAYQENEDGARRRVGLWLREQTPDTATVAMEAIGYQGALSRRRVIDLAGLISPQVLRLREKAMTNAEWYAGVFTELRPDFLVLRSFEVDDNRHRDGGPMFASDRQRHDFDRLYREAARFVAPHPEIWGRNASITIYHRAAEEAD